MRCSHELDQCVKCGEKVAWIGIWTNAIMVVMKIYVGLISGSRSCIADGLHSFSNIITALAIILSQKFVKKERDEKYPLGYGKIEFVAAAFVSLFIITAASLIILLSIKQLAAGNASKPPHFSALLSAVVSIGVNEMLFRYMRCVGTRLSSQTILANAWANRADTVSSIAVIMGVLGAHMGFAYLDSLCAIIVVAVIVKVSWDILTNSIKALMDASVNNICGREIELITSEIEEVREMTELKTRRVGRKIWAELSICIDSGHTIKESETIAQKIKTRLADSSKDIQRVVIYFKPCGTKTK